MSDWSKVTREDVIKAIEKFNKEKPDYAKSRTTYFISGMPFFTFL